MRIVLLIIMLFSLLILLNSMSIIIVKSTDTKGGHRGKLIPLVEGFAERIEFREIQEVSFLYSPGKETLVLEGFKNIPSKTYLVLGIATSSKDLYVASVFINNHKIDFKVNSIYVLEGFMPYFSVIWGSVPPSSLTSENLNISIEILGEEAKCTIEGGLLLGIYEGKENCYYKLYVGPYAVYRCNATIPITLNARVRDLPVNVTMSVSGDENADIIIEKAELNRERKEFFALVKGYFSYSDSLNISISSFSVSALKICYLLFYTSPTVFYEPVILEMKNVPKDYLKLINIRVDNRVFKVNDYVTIIRLPRRFNTIELYIGKYRFRTIEVNAPGTYSVHFPFNECTIRAETSYGTPVDIAVKVGGTQVSKGLGWCTAQCLEGFTEIELKYKGHTLVYKYNRDVSKYIFPTGLVGIRWRDALYRIRLEVTMELPEGRHFWQGGPISYGWVKYPSVEFEIARSKESIVELYPYVVFYPSVHVQIFFYISFISILVYWSLRSIRNSSQSLSRKAIIGKIGSVLLRLHWILLPVYFLLYVNPVIAYILPLGMILLGTSVLLYNIGRPLNLILSLIPPTIGLIILLQFIGIIEIPYPFIADEVYSGYSRSPIGLLSLSLALSIFFTVALFALDMFKEKVSIIAVTLVLSTISLLAYTYIYEVRLYIPREVFYIIFYVVSGLIALSMSGDLVDLMEMRVWCIPKRLPFTKRIEPSPIAPINLEPIRRSPIPSEVEGFIRKADEDFEKWRYMREGNMALIYLRNAFENLFNATIAAVRLYLGEETTRWGELKKLLESRDPKLAKEFRRFIGIHVKIYRKGEIPTDPLNYYMQYRKNVLDFIHRILTGIHKNSLSQE